MLRYWIALLAAGGGIAGNVGLGCWLRHSALEDIRRSLVAAQAAGELPPEMAGRDWSRAQWSDLEFDLEMPQTTLTKLSCGDLILNLWWGWTPGILALCLTLAWWWPHRRQASPALHPPDA